MHSWYPLNVGWALGRRLALTIRWNFSLSQPWAALFLITILCFSQSCNGRLDTQGVRGIAFRFFAVILCTLMIPSYLSSPPATMIMYCILGRALPGHHAPLMGISGSGKRALFRADMLDQSLGPEPMRVGSPG